MDRKIIVLDILCFESFFNSSIGRKSKSEIFYLHESNLFFFIKNIYSKYFDVKFTNLGNLSYSENRIGSRTIYEAIQEETKRDIFSFLESQPFKKNLSSYIKTDSSNDQKLNYSLVNQLYPFFYRTREVLTLIEFEGIEPDVFLVRKTHFNNLSIENTKILIQNYKLLFSNLFSISVREDSHYDSFIYKKYNTSLYLIFIKEFFKKLLIFTNFFAHKALGKNNNFQTKGSHQKDQEIIGVELLQSRINLSETNDLFFIDNSIIHDEQICLIEYDEQPRLLRSLFSSINKRNEPKMKYGSESYDVISNRKFNRLKIINIINLLNQRYAGEVNSSYSISNLGFLIGPKLTLSYLLSLIKLFFNYRNKDSFLKFLVMQYEFDSNYYSKIFEKANLKILWSMFDGGDDQLIRSQAIETANGYFCGSHWSHYAMTCIDNQKCYDILFAWSDHFSEMLNEYYQSKKTFIVGYPSLGYVDKYMYSAKKIRDLHPDKFIITLNDNTYFNDGPVSEEAYYSFYNLALNVLEQFDNTIIYLKPKRSNHLNAYIKENKRFEEFITNGRVNLLITDHSRSKVPPAFPALFSDLVLGLGLSTTTIESTITGALSFNVINQSVFRENKFYKNGLHKIVYTTQESIIKAIDKVIAHKDNSFYLE